VFEAFCNHSASHLSDSVRAPVGIRGQAGGPSHSPQQLGTQSSTHYGIGDRGGEVARLLIVVIARHLGIVEQHDRTRQPCTQRSERDPCAVGTSDAHTPHTSTPEHDRGSAHGTKAGFTPKVARSRVIPVEHSSEATFLNTATLLPLARVLLLGPDLKTQDSACLGAPRPNAQRTHRTRELQDSRLTSPACKL
jgi:hypothetical protein